MCDTDFGDRAELSSWTFRKARKQHRCVACGGVIAAGKRYGILFTVFDGEAQSDKSCLPCHRAGNKFGADHHLIPHPSGLSEALQECIDEEPSSAKRWRPVLRAMLARGAA